MTWPLPPPPCLLMWKPRPREESLVESCPGVALCSWVWRVPGNRKRRSGFCSWGEGPDTQLTLMIQRALVGRETAPLHPGQQRGRPAHSGPLRQHQKPKEPVTDLGPDSASTNPCARCESHAVLQAGRGQVWDVEPREQGSGPSCPSGPRKKRGGERALDLLLRSWKSSFGPRLGILTSS